MPVVKIDPNDKYPRIYWPDELKRFGYAGNVEVICDPFTGTIINPNATPEQIIQSLENRIRDIRLRGVEHAEFRPLEGKQVKAPTEKAPELEWENITCPYQDCRAPLMWHVSWEQATCSRCGRPIVRQKIQG
ncbi:MAG: hypothetical protein JXA46_02555 [Dehalococcoidales bacterium]|nr:hypothetical protein [Dehalococcoidales bacterium]